MFLTQPLFRGQKYFKNFVGFLVETMRPKRHFEFIWPFVYLEFLSVYFSWNSPDEHNLLKFPFFYYFQDYICWILGTFSICIFVVAFIRWFLNAFLEWPGTKNIFLEINYQNYFQYKLKKEFPGEFSQKLQNKFP